MKGCLQKMNLNKISLNLCSRNFSKSNSKQDFPEDLLPYLSGRRRHERKDSVTIEILRERQAFDEKLEAIPKSIALNAISNQLDDAGFGSKKKREKFDTIIQFSERNNTNNIFLVFYFILFCIGGVATHLNSSSGNWPIFEHTLPEIAFAGHSNCGKVSFNRIIVITY